jgi:hypothetical protein
VCAAGIKGAAAKALIDNAESALKNMGFQRTLLGMGADAIIKVHGEQLGTLRLSQVVDATREMLGQGFDQLVKTVESQSPKVSAELAVCFSSATTLFGVQGLFSNFGPMTKFHDLEGQSAAVLQVCAPTFTMTPTCKDGVAGLKLEEGGRSGFFPLSTFLTQADALINLAATPQGAIVGSLASCQQRGLLLAILSYAAKVPGILNGRHTYAGLKTVDSSFSRAATEQVSELYNALDAKFRVVYGDGTHQAILTT